MSKKERGGEEFTFYCRVESFFATKDYARGGRCVRFIGVDPKDFTNLTQSDDAAVTTFVIDIDFWRYAREYLAPIDFRGNHQSPVFYPDDDSPRHNEWYKLEVTTAKKSNEYFYGTFSEDEPTYLTLTSLTPLAANFGPLRAKLSPLKHLQMMINSDPSTVFLGGGKAKLRAPFKFDTFHVGQGMCSLVSNTDVGILLDAGAGKPVTRPRYQKKYLKNELDDAIKDLVSLDIVVSHVDYDHWKLLAWDANLLKKIKNIFVPDGVDHLVFKDKAIKKKCVDTGSVVFPLDEHSHLQVIRSRPISTDSNGECLVSVFHRSSDRVLMPGDYVYMRLSTDTGPHMSALLGQGYNAVVVPHHGDEASAKLVVPNRGAEPVAFFSAGTHQYYKHPTQVSLDAHNAAGFTTVSDKTQPHIIKVTLL
jgi:beta-lactamase superfamily II metal-dependent hydrolase